MEEQENNQNIFYLHNYILAFVIVLAFAHALSLGSSTS